jgi:hypothetical protein
MRSDPTAGRGGPALAARAGETSAVYPGTYGDVWEAALTALNELEIAVVTTTRDALGGEIEARRAADDVEVALKVEPVERNRTRVRIRIGAAGDPAASEQIQRRISTALVSR